MIAIIGSTAWFARFAGRVKEVDSAVIAAVTTAYGLTMGALLIVFFILAIGNYEKDRLEHLVAGGKETIGKFLDKGERR